MSQEPVPAARRAARPITRDYLFRAAAHYLERYASSTGNLRRVLTGKVRRRARERGEDPDAFSALVEETIARLTELRLLDDGQFAEARVASLRRKGTSRRHLFAKLAEKGVDRETAAIAVAADGTHEEAAAHAYARRRRLGPFRSSGREERRDRDVAAMVRAGFGFTLAVAVVDGDGVEPEPGA